MSIDKDLLNRCGGVCELCSSDVDLSAYIVEPKDEEIVVCSTCLNSISNPLENEKHWNCLSDAMWSEVPAVIVVSYRLLSKLKAQDKLDMMYMEDDVLEWAKDVIEEVQEDVKPTRDSNGAILSEGDTVTIIKDLVVKGAGFTAKRGTLVKRIMLTENPEHIEGKVNGTQIVLLAKYLKKMS